MKSKLSIQDVWIILAGYLAAIHVGKLSAIIPILQKELNLSFTQAGLSLSLVQGAGMLFAVLIGTCAERWGLKRSLITALTVLGLSSLAGLWIENIATLYFFRFLEGIGFLTISLCAPAILKRISKPETMNFKMGLWSSYMGIGVCLAVLSIPLLLEWFSWRDIWAMLGLLSLFIAFMIHQFLHICNVHSDCLPPHLKKLEDQDCFWFIIKTTFTHKPVLLLALTFCCYTSQWITVTGFLPTMYVEQGLDLRIAGGLVSLVVLANLGGTFGAGVLLQRGYHPAVLLKIGFIAMCCSSFLTFAASNWLVFEIQYVSAILFSLLGGLIPTTIFSITLNHLPRADAAAASIGLVLQCSALAQFFVPPISAFFVSQTLSWSSVAWVCFSLSSMGLFFALTFFRRSIH